MGTFATDLLTGQKFLFHVTIGGTSTGSTTTYPEVSDFGELPTASSYTGKIYVVRVGTGESHNMTLNASGEQITIVEGGIYLFNYAFSFSYSTNNTTVHIDIYIDDTENNKAALQRKIGTGGDVGNGGSTAIYSFTAGQVVDMRITGDLSCDAVIDHGDINFVRIL